MDFSKDQLLNWVIGIALLGGFCEFCRDTKIPFNPRNCFGHVLWGALGGFCAAVFLYAVGQVMPNIFGWCAHPGISVAVSGLVAVGVVRADVFAMIQRIIGGNQK